MDRILLELEQSCKTASLLLKAQESAMEQRGRVTILERQLQEERSVRDRLIAELKLAKQSKRIEHVVVDRLGHARNKKVLRMNSLQEKISAQILEESKERFAAEVATAFRMTGRSLYHCSKNEIGVRLEAFYNGTFFIPYYVKFRLNSLIRSDSFDVQFQSHMIHRPIFFVLSHSLPQCVPIQELERKHLSPGILNENQLDALLREVEAYLHAYISRREQINQLRNRSDCCDISVNPDNYASVQFTIIRSEERCIYVRLIYDRLEATRPTRALAYEECKWLRYRLLII